MIFSMYKILKIADEGVRDLTKPEKRCLVDMDYQTFFVRSCFNIFIAV